MVSAKELRKDAEVAIRCSPFEDQDLDHQRLQSILRTEIWIMLYQM